MFTADGKPSDDDPREHGPMLGDERTTLVDSLRRQRLTVEMKCAGLDAEAMAKAAGLQLGQLLEITAYPSNDRPMVDYAMAGSMQLKTAAPMPTPVNAGELTISETVMVRWAVVKQ